MPQHSVQIHSDGTPNGTKLITESGEVIDHVTHADISLDGREFATVTLTIMMPVVQGRANVDEITFVCPVCEGDVVHQCATGQNISNSPMIVGTGITVTKLCYCDNGATLGNRVHPHEPLGLCPTHPEPPPTPPRT